jgi:nucleoside-diphosphate-sugar epimerase
MARVLVTGGTGFIGRHLVESLVQRGDQVRCLIRRPGRKTLPGPQVEYVRGDVAGQGSLTDAVRGVEIVYHLAGATLPMLIKEFKQVNAEGTRRLAEACANQPRPPVFVYISSLAAAGPARAGLPLTETSPSRPVSAYGRSKLAGERYLQALANRLPITVLRPPMVYGPGDLYTLKLFALARSGLNVVAGFKLFPLAIIHVTDLVEAMHLAAERGRRLAPVQESPNDQGLYFVAMDDQITLVQMARLAAEVQGRRPPLTICLPSILCWFIAWFNDCRSPLMGRPYFLNSDKIREALAGAWICSADKAKRELGFLCRTDLAGGFAGASQWYRDQGWL